MMAFTILLGGIPLIDFFGVLGPHAVLLLLLLLHRLLPSSLLLSLSLCSSQFCILMAVWVAARLPVGHLYFYLDTVLPAVRGVRLLQTPHFLYNLFPREYNMYAPAAQQQQQPAGALRFLFFFFIPLRDRRAPRPAIFRFSPLCLP